MSDPVPPKPPKSDKADPQLESLLAKARPVIAAERGLNHKSRVKIQSLGKKMKIPVAVIDQALQLLHGAPPVPGAEESRYEREFAKVMEQKISGIPGKILTTRIEEKAISVGTRKYQLSQMQARTIVRRVAEDVGVPRVTLTEAERHIEKEIADLIAEATWVSKEKQQRLLRNGKRLGVQADQTQSMIQRHLQFNFQQVQFERKLTDRLWIIAAVLIVGTGFGLFIFLQLKQSKKEIEAITKLREKEEITPKKIDEIPGRPQTPDWWDDSLKVLLQKTRLKISGFAELHDQMKNRDPATRAAAYQNLFSLDAEKVNPAVIRQRISAVIPGLYKSDPASVAANGLLNGLAKFIQMPPGQVPKATGFFEKAFWGLSLLNGMVGDEKLTDQKVAAIQNMIEPISGRKFDLFLSVEPRLRKQKQALSEHYFKNLADIGPSYPELAPGIFAKLEDLTSDHMPEDKIMEFRNLFLNAFLRFDVDKWQTCAKLIEKAIRDSPVSQLSFFIDLMENTKNEPLQAYLETMLLKRTGLTVETGSAGDIANTLRDYLKISSPKVKVVETPWLERVDQLMIEYSDKWINTPVQLDNRQLAQLLAESSYLATVMCLLDSGNFSGMETLVELGFPAIDDPKYMQELTGSAGKETEPSQPPGFKDQKPRLGNQQMARERLQIALKQLNQFRILKTERRINAIGLLQRTARNISSISGTDATILAEYLLSRKSPKENQRVLVAVREFRHWPKLVIAISDQLRQKPFPHKTSLDITSLLVDQDLAYEGPGWPEKLSQHLFVTGMQQLEAKQEAALATTRSDPFANLKTILSTFYRLRAQSLQLDTRSIAQGKLESIMDLCLGHYRGLLTALKKNTPLDRVMRDLDIQVALGTDPLTRVQLKQGTLLTCLLALGKPAAADPKNTEALLKLETLLKNRLSVSPSIVGQIAENEIKILLFYYRQTLK